MKNIKIRFFILCLCLSVTGYTSASARTEKSKNGYRLACFHAKTRFDLGNTARILV